jgi:4-amino-4-deoxy-L-arabinose transferase-like glycosyltransferase
VNSSSEPGKFSRLGMSEPPSTRITSGRDQAERGFLPRFQESGRSLTSVPEVSLLFAVSTIVALVLFWRLGQGSLHDWDEGIYAETSREMIRSGNWLTEYFNYQPHFLKPPLFMWSTAVLFKLFGVNEVWARATAAGCGVALVAATYLVARQTYDRLVACLSATILLTSYVFAQYARMGTIETMLAFFTVLSIFAYQRLADGNPNWWYLIAVSSGLALMAKSVAGLVGPIVVALTVLIDRRAIVTLKTRQMWIGVAIVVLIAAPWHIVMLVQHGRAFFDQYVQYNVFSRATRPVLGNQEGPFYYVATIKTFFFPWAYLAPFAFLFVLVDVIRGKAGARVLVVGALFLLFFYTAARTRLTWYIYPIYPILAIMAASLISRTLANRSRLMGVGGTLVTIAVAGSSYTRHLGIYVPLLVVIAALLSVPRFTVRRITVLAATTTYAMIGIATMVPLYQEGTSPVAALSAYSTVTRSPIVQFPGDRTPTTLFYFRRPVEHSPDPASLSRFLANHQAKDILVTRHDLPRLSGMYYVHIRAAVGSLVYGTIRH